MAERSMETMTSEDGPHPGGTGSSLRWIVAVLLGAKLVAVGLSWHDGGAVAASSALAEDAPASPALAVVKPQHEDEGGAPARTEHARGDVKSLLESLSRRQAELDAREKALAAREDKLALYEKDVTEKIAQLEQVGKTLKEDLKRSSAVSDEAAASLAKVYGAMKPAEAAPILDQLDEATALRILTRMKEKQVGEILPLMTRERAIVLTRSLAGRVVPPSDPASRPKS